MKEANAQKENDKKDGWSKREKTIMFSLKGMMKKDASKDKEKEGVQRRCF